MASRETVRRLVLCVACGAALTLGADFLIRRGCPEFGSQFRFRPGITSAKPYVLAGWPTDSSGLAFSSWAWSSTDAIGRPGLAGVLNGPTTPPAPLSLADAEGRFHAPAFTDGVASGGLWDDPQVRATAVGVPLRTSVSEWATGFWSYRARRVAWVGGDLAVCVWDASRVGSGSLAQAGIRRRWVFVGGGIGNIALFSGVLYSFVLLAAAWRGRWRERRGLCRACGYDLRGLGSLNGAAWLCPECGRTVGAGPRARAITPGPRA